MALMLKILFQKCAQAGTLFPSTKHLLPVQIGHENFITPQPQPSCHSLSLRGSFHSALWLSDSINVILVCSFLFCFYSQGVDHSLTALARKAFQLRSLSPNFCLCRFCPSLLLLLCLLRKSSICTFWINHLTQEMRLVLFELENNPFIQKCVFSMCCRK